MKLKLADKSKYLQNNHYEVKKATAKASNKQIYSLEQPKK